MKYSFDKTEERRIIDGLLFEIGLESKVERKFQIDFRNKTFKFKTGKKYPYFSEERKIEDIERVFYKEKNQNGKDNDNLLLIGEYYNSGMMHDIVIFHKCSSFSDGWPIYLYQDELEKNSDSQSKERKNIIPEPALFTRIGLEELDNSLIVNAIFNSPIDKNKIRSQYLNQIKRYLTITKHSGSEFNLRSPIEFDRTTPMFKEIFGEHIHDYHFSTGTRITQTKQELEQYAKKIWVELKN